jgi:hypothetical protein
MKLDSLSEYLPGWLALLCAIAVFVAAAVDVPGDQAPLVTTVVQATP